LLAPRLIRLFVMTAGLFSVTAPSHDLTASAEVWRMALGGAPKPTEVQAAHEHVLALVAADARRPAPIVTGRLSDIVAERLSEILDPRLTVPFQPMVFDPSPCGAHGNAVAAYSGWAPADEVSNGAEVLRLLSARLTQGPFDCKRGKCRILVEDSSDSEWRHIDLCTVRSVGGVAGVPESCEAVALLRQNEGWLRIWADRSPIIECQASAFFNLTGRFGYTMSVETGAGPERFVPLLSGLLSGPPFSLSTSLDEADTSAVIGVASQRLSPILAGGFRELIEVRGQTFRRAVDSPVVTLELSATLYVSKQNPGNLDEYRGPSEGQRGEYANAFGASLTTLLQRKCKAFTAHATDAVRCDL